VFEGKKEIEVQWSLDSDFSDHWHCPEHHRRLVREVFDQPSRIVSICFQPMHIVLRSVEHAARVPTTIIGDDHDTRHTWRWAVVAAHPGRER
jgi:hypothetical protein